jgi:hypothetical protein
MLEAGRITRQHGIGEHGGPNAWFYRLSPAAGSSRRAYGRRPAEPNPQNAPARPCARPGRRRAGARKRPGASGTELPRPGSNLAAPGPNGDGYGWLDPPRSGPHNPS